MHKASNDQNQRSAERILRETVYDKQIKCLQPWPACIGGLLKTSKIVTENIPKQNFRIKKSGYRIRSYPHCRLQKHVPEGHEHHFNKGRESIRLFNTVPTTTTKQTIEQIRIEACPWYHLTVRLYPRKHKTPSQCWS
jgi:hypothetical protein